MTEKTLGRRRFITRLAGGGAALLLAGCDKLSQTPWFPKVLGSASKVNETLQPLVTGPRAMAQEFPEADISPHFKANGTINPPDASYQTLAASDFAAWKLKVDGLVEQPADYSLADLRAMPSRTQITRHDCVEGWSCIGKWKGVQLSRILDQVKPKPAARFVVFHCADTMDEAADGSPIRYYESMDFGDAYHPQTILAYEMNDQTLSIPHGAPLRVRNERQLGYKMAKYIMRIELVESFADIGDGHGGYWEDQGYAWYAGI